jgi:cell division septation protein DedD
MAENRKDNGGLYYFSKTQLVVVGTGFAATCVVVFLLGILIGQGIEERKLLKQEEPLVKVPLQPPAPGSKQGSSKDELTFYDTLAKTPSGSQPAKAAKAGEKAAKPELKKPKEPQEAKPPVKEIKTAKASGTEVTQASAQKPKEKTAAENAAAAETKKVAPAKSAEEEKNKTETASPDRVWTVQVNAFPEEARAQKLVERLKQKGYDAYLVKANINGKDWFRVRVGHFAARGQTKELLEELQTKENFTKAIAVSR